MNLKSVGSLCGHPLQVDDIIFSSSLSVDWHHVIQLDGWMFHVVWTIWTGQDQIPTFQMTVIWGKSLFLYRGPNCCPVNLHPSLLHSHSNLQANQHEHKECWRAVTEKWQFYLAILALAIFGLEFFPNSISVTSGGLRQWFRSFKYSETFEDFKKTQL